MNPFDIFVIVLIVLSGLFAFARGFVRETLSVGTWVGASFAALYAFPFARPIAERWLAKGIFADSAASLSVFVVVLIALSLVSSAISLRDKHSSLSTLDRTLGCLFGLVRGVILASLVYIPLASPFPAPNPPPP